MSIKIIFRRLKIPNRNLFFGSLVFKKYKLYYTVLCCFSVKSLSVRGVFFSFKVEITDTKMSPCFTAMNVIWKSPNKRGEGRI